MSALPIEIAEDLKTFAEKYRQYKAGEVDELTFKTVRVPFGIYEQRERGTFMARVKLAAGIISADELMGAAGLAEEFAQGFLHVSTRGGLQLHGVKAENFLPVLEGLHEIGLTGRGGGGNTVRNITCDVYSGVSKDELFDVTPYALALHRKMLTLKDSYALPRKYKIAFSASPKDRGGATFADLGFIAALKNGERGFKVYIAGGLGAKPKEGVLYTEFLPAGELFAFAQSLKEIFNEHGNRRNKNAARLRFLLEDMGVNRLKELVEEKKKTVAKDELTIVQMDEAPPSAVSYHVLSQALKDVFNDHGNRSDKHASRLRFLLEDMGVDRFKELVEEKKKTVAKDELTIVQMDEALPSAVSYHRPEGRLFINRFAVPQRQAGRYTLKIPLLYGNIKSGDAKKLAELLNGFECAELRLGQDQNLYIRNLNVREVAEHLYPLALEITPLAGKAALFGDIVTCTGANTCQLGITVPRGLYNAIERELLFENVHTDALQGFKIHISGCPNSCGRHHIGDLGFFGKALRKDGHLYPAYNIVAGARTGDGVTRFAVQLADISAYRLPAFLIELLTRIAPTPIKGESFAKSIERYGFVYFTPIKIDMAAWVDGEGEKIIKELAEKYKEIPSFEEDKNPYYDFGAAELFSLKGRGAGECSAGMYDILEADLKALKEALSNELSGDNLKSIRLLAARALLITRGEEGVEEEEIFRLFKKHFIATGLVSKELERVLEGGADLGAVKLAEAVLALAATMDNSLKFAGEREVPPPAKKATVKDFRGVACPMNFVKTKMELAKLAKGEVLEIFLDDGAPIENVPRSVQAEGHTVESETKTDGYWIVRIIR